MKLTIRNLLIFAGVVLLILGFWYFRNIVAYVLISGVLSLIGRPLVDLLSRIRLGRFHIHRGISALFTVILLWGVIFLTLIIFVPLVSEQVNQFSSIDSRRIVQLIESPLKQMESVIAFFNSDLAQEISVQNYVMGKVSEVLSAEFIQNFLTSVMSIFGNIAVAIFSITFITFFFLKDERLFYESIMMWVPEKYEEGARRALSSIKHLLMRYFIGIIIQSTCITILITTGMSIVGLQFQQALTIGLIIGTLNVIPYVGPWLGGLIGITMGVASNLDMSFTGVVIPLVTYMVIVIIITQLIDNIVFQPVIFSSSVNAHPLEIFIVILAAGSFAGVAGMILAIPGYTVLRVVGKEFFNNFKAVKVITSGLDHGSKDRDAENPL
ncbi:MAG: AI-2E family transporter [Bacteroidales bacterium]|nr:AI-2E family transporter [Bacteroidales bacterium]